MKSYSYKKTKDIRLNIGRILSGLLVVIGASIVFYISFPLISWHIYFTPVFASLDVTAPIPKTTILTKEGIKTLVTSASQKIAGANYKDAHTWFPTYQIINENEAKQTTYTLVIPKLKIKDGIVSTSSYDLSKHLVHYGGTAMPPNNGNTVIFGHSTLPQLFNPNDYTTIFANAHKLEIGDEIIATINNVSYTYRVKTILVVNPTDTSIFSQEFLTPHLTLVTCTPPGTTWKRLIIRGELEKI